MSTRLSLAGKYELLDVAGEGGMATVWRAVTRGAAGFVTPVAVKRIQPRFSDSPGFIAMFVEEARVGAQLRHPNIVQILDFGTDEAGGYFLVMEWVDGLDLGRLIRVFSSTWQQPVPWPLATAIAAEALRGLHAAHRRTDVGGQVSPVIHRDVAPQNVLVSVHGAVKLSDFGLSRAMDRARMTDPDILKGKLAYVAPELTFGHEATVQSDIFSLGVVLWEALAGRRLREAASDAETFIMARDAVVPPITDHRTDLPPALVAVLARALSQDPAQRQSSAEALRLELAGVLREASTPADASAIASAVRDARRAVGEPEVSRFPVPTPPSMAALVGSAGPRTPPIASGPSPRRKKPGY